MTADEAAKSTAARIINSHTSIKELRRSTRESSSLSSSSSSSVKETTPASISLNGRKSERLEKQPPVAPPTMKKSAERVKNQENQENTQCPLRRSDRGKRQFQEYGVMLDVRNKKGEDVVKIGEKLTIESEKVHHSDGEEQPIVDGKRKKMSSRSYKAIFKKQRRKKSTPDDNDAAELSIHSVVNITCSADDGDEVGEGFIEESVKYVCDDNTFDKGKTVKNVEVELSFSGLKHNEVSDGHGEKNANQKITLNILETCNTCSKRQRVDIDSENETLCTCKGNVKKGVHAISESIMEPLLKLPAGCQPGVDNASLSIVGKLCEYWRKGKSAMFFDEQERAKRIILYILSFSNITKPFLIITSSNYLSHWKAEFSRLEPSIDVLVYTGNKDNRKGIRNLMFYEEGGQIMFQVLLSSMEVVVEDIQMLQTLKWESIIVDDCQRPRITRLFGIVKTLSTYSKVLMFSAPIKESVIEYQNLLSFLNDSAIFDDDLCKLKDSVKEYIAYECKFSKYVEYWLPVQISNVQLEQYCATLLKNDSASALCSNLKHDPLVALRDALFSSRKCCDHPYLVDPSIQTSLTKDLDPAKYLDVGIQASGKLQLLDEILSELKRRQLRVVILYQCIGGTGQDSMGNILDDFLRQRFGQDSYERINASVKNSMKIEAMNKFNDKRNRRFFFLIEFRACLSTVKLCSVGSIVIFNSDFHPYNDIKALHKTTIGSPFQQIKIFRLYSSFTVEEKVLILAKQNIALDARNANQSSSLLTWGASYLFKKLDEFHISNITDVSCELGILKNVFKEFVDVISQNDEIDETRAMIAQVQHDSGCYKMSSPLLGETNIQLAEREKPHVFWTKLLVGRNPRWKFFPSQNQRQRKRGHIFTELPEKPEKIGYENEGIGKKQKKTVSLAKLPEGPNADNVAYSFSKSVAKFIDKIDLGPASNFLSSDVRSHSPKNLHLQLKSDLLMLCEILKLSDDEKVMVGKFLDYVVESHQVSREPESIFQAFQLSMCWIAASLSKHKMDKKESLALAKNHLQFICKEEEAESVYSKLRSMKKDFVLKNPSLTSGALNPQEEKLQTIEKKCEKRMAKLIQNQTEEIKEFGKSWDCKFLELEQKHKLEAAVVRTIHHNNVSALRDKQKRLEENLKKHKDELQQEKDECLKDLHTKHVKERLDEKLKVASWLSKASGAADNVDEVLPPGAAEILPHVTTEILSPDTTEALEMRNVDAGNIMNDEDSPSMLDPLVKRAVTSESPLSDDVECGNEGSQPLHSRRVRVGTPSPQSAVQSNQISMAPIEIPTLLNVNDLLISTSEPTIVESSTNILGPTPSLNIDTSASATSASRLRLAPSPSRRGTTVSHNATELPQPSGQALHLHVDPLHNELDRIRTETEQTVKTYEDMKSKLKSDCNKEIEDMIAKIQKKYEVKFKDVEVAFRSRKKQLDDNHNKVSMNKVLAYAFRSKCLSPSSGINTKAGLSSFVHQFSRSTVPSIRRTSVAPSAAALVNHSSLGGPPEATQLTMKAVPQSSAINVCPGAPRSSAINGTPPAPSPSRTSVVRVPPVNSSQSGPPPASAHSPIPSASRITAITSSLGVKGRLGITGSPAVKGPPVVPFARKDMAAIDSPAVRGSMAVLSATTQVKVSTTSSLAGPPPATTKSLVLSAIMVPAVTDSLPVNSPPLAISSQSVKDSLAIISSPTVEGPLVVPPAPMILPVTVCTTISDPPAVPLTTTQTKVSTTTGPPASNVTQMVPSTVNSTSQGTQAATSGTTQLKAPTVESSPAGPLMSTTPLPVTSATKIMAPTLSPAAPPLAATLQIPVPPLQVVRESTALFSTTPNKTLTIPPITPSIRDHQFSGGEIHGPAPHLQLFKPPPVSALMPRTAPDTPQLKNHQTSMSAMELLLDVDSRTNGYNSLPPLPELDSNFALLDLSEFGPPLTTQVSLTLPALGTDNIVILSDED